MRFKLLEQTLLEVKVNVNPEHIQAFTSRDASPQSKDEALYKIVADTLAQAKVPEQRAKEFFPSVKRVVDRWGVEPQKNPIYSFLATIVPFGCTAEHFDILVNLMLSGDIPKSRLESVV